MMIKRLESSTYFNACKIDEVCKVLQAAWLIYRTHNKYHPLCISLFVTAKVQKVSGLPQFPDAAL